MPETNHDNRVIEQTRKWPSDVIIGFNFCPFAKREFDQGKIRYSVIHQQQLEHCLQGLVNECIVLDKDIDTETSLERALQSHPDPEQIPQRNIALARKTGLEKIQQLLANCLQHNKTKG